MDKKLNSKERKKLKRTPTLNRKTSAIEVTTTLVYCILHYIHTEFNSGP